MGMNLDQLLDATGIGEMSGQTKTAAATSTRPDFLKLADRCRRAAEATPAERVDDHDRELVEKTAEVAIISRTLSEIESIMAGSEKTASPGVGVEKTASFVQEALRAGHSPEDIAVFLKTAGWGGDAIEKTLDFFRNPRAKAMANIGRGEKLLAAGSEVGGQGVRSLQDTIRQIAESGTEDEGNALIRRLRVGIGDEKAGKLLATSGAKLNRFGEARAILPRDAASVTIGAKRYGVTGDQAAKAAKYGLPAVGGAAVGAGLAGGIGGHAKKKGNVVILGG